MHLTPILCRQHLGRTFNNHWRIQGKRKVLRTPAERVLKERNIKIFQPEDILRPRTHIPKYDVVGYKDKPVRFDKTHPNWHSEPLLTFKDNNVLVEGLNQAQILTKSVQISDGLPTRITLNDLPKDVNSQCKRIILNSHVFDAEQVKLPKVKDPERPAWNFPRTYGISQDRIFKLITSKLLNLVESTVDYSLTKQRYILNDLLFSFPFERNGELIQFQLKSDILLSASKPLIPLTNQQTEDVDLPDIYPVKHTITLSPENIYTIENIFPIKKGIVKAHPHTILVNFNKEFVKNLYEEEVTNAQIMGRSLLKTFTVAAAYARQIYGPNVQTLPTPVALQCIQTDGRQFHFGILQLNTLDLEEGGVQKNIWYQTDLMPLFEKCCYVDGRPTLEGYNSDVIKHLYGFYNNV